MVALTGSKIKAVGLASGHMPLLSMPEKFVEVLGGVFREEWRYFGACASAMTDVCLGIRSIALQHIGGFNTAFSNLP